MKLCDKIKLWFHWDRGNSDNIKTTAKDGGNAKTATSSSQTGNATSLNIDVLHLHQEGNSGGKRRKAIKELEVAANGISWAIEQSKKIPKVGNKPSGYLTKLKTAYDTNYEFLSKADIEVLEPPIQIVVDYRKDFSQLQDPLEKLFEAISSLK